MFNLLEESVHDKIVYYPMISFVVPAYNEEKRISGFIASLFKCAAHYPGFSEIIVVDDGSTDYTYEIAWAAIEINRKEWPYVGGKIVRHSTTLGKEEAVKTGANKAMGSVIAVVNEGSKLNLHPTLQQSKQSQILGIFPCTQNLGNTVSAISSLISLYEANMLREILNGGKMPTVKKPAHGGENERKT